MDTLWLPSRKPCEGGTVAKIFNELVVVNYTLRLYGATQLR